jgi:hypothetical protein
MRTVTIAILGAPFAAWALHGCLLFLGVTEASAVAAAVVWGVLWLSVAHLGRSSKLFRRRRSAEARGAPGGRGVWTGAVLSSFFLPVPIYGLAIGFEWLNVASASLTVPAFTLLALPLPSALWWMLLWPRVADRDGEIIHPLGWRRYTPHAPSGVIPPRKRSALGK